MKKIPSIFLRDWEGNRSLVTKEKNPECQWVFDGEGIPTRKWDGTCCMIREGKLYKRYDAKFDKKKSIWKPKPEGFEPCQEPDEVTGHQPGWIPVDFTKKENKWFKMAWDLIDDEIGHNYGDNIYYQFPNPRKYDGTYELCGITINGNPEGINGLYFIKHGYRELDMGNYEYENYESFKSWLACNPIEGIVFHHPDGRMAKIKRSDFGFDWPPIR